MHILLITDSYPPEIRSASHLMQEMAEGLRDRGHRVTVITSYPQYNLSDECSSKKYGELSVEDDVTILRIKTLPHHKVNFIVRGISQLTMPYIFMSKLKKHLDSRVDAVIVYSPPLPLAITGNMVKKKYGAKFIFNIQDIFPQNAVDLGILNKKYMISFFRKLENWAYEKADVLAVHSDGNKELLMKGRSFGLDKVEVLHNWVDIDTYAIPSNGNSYRKKYGLENKFIFLFAGVIGLSQGLDLVLDVADRLCDLENVCFLIVGDGSEKQRLVNMAEGRALENVVFKPFISKQDYASLLKEVDVGVVCLSSKNKTPVVPGKILGYMAANVPVVAFLNRESDGHKVIKDSGCGYSVFSDDLNDAVKVVRQIYDEKSKIHQYGCNGFEYAKNNFSKDVCIDRMEQIFNGGLNRE